MSPSSAVNPSLAAAVVPHADPGTGGPGWSHDDCPGPERARVRVIDKAVELLDVLAGASAGLHLAEITRQVGINRSTAHRILATLESHRLVMRDEQLRFRLGFRLFELGSAVKEHHLAFHGAALTHLRRTAEVLGLTAFLAIRDRDRTLYVEQAVFGEFQYIPYPAGTSLALNLGAASRVLLAHAPDEDQQQLLTTAVERLTVMSITDPAALREDIRSIREQGVAISDGDVVLGLGAIGAPVRNARNDVIAAVSLAGISQRLFGPDRANLIAAVAALGEAVSRELGWDGQT